MTTGIVNKSFCPNCINGNNKNAAILGNLNRLEGLTLVVASSYAEDYSISFLLNFVSLQNIVFCFAQLI